tara:strand:- start:10760 stop:11188 length:429 start_codon:yes stop_codon:yes gene_type:complete
MYKSRKKNESALLNALKELANSYKSRISTYDFGPSFAIGTDENNTYVFFSKVGQNQTIDLCVPISKIKKCYINAESHTVTRNKHAEMITDKLELVFEPKDKSLAPCRFEFFNSDERFQPNGERLLAQKWETLVNGQLRKVAV